jgi:YHS domain-containing protein
MQRVISFGVLMLIGLATQLPTAGAASARPEVFSTSDGAIRGYDTVAYFADSRAVRGQSEFKHSWNGAAWFFASEENLELFRAGPERYAPQYGGYCAYAMSKGSFASTDPKAWTIYDGKLYLNYSISIRKTWKKDIPGYIRKADRNWAQFAGNNNPELEGKQELYVHTI